LKLEELYLSSMSCFSMNIPASITPQEHAGLRGLKHDGTFVGTLVADAVRSFRPRILYPYHFGQTEPSTIMDLLKGEDVEVRIRTMG
jgi:hypothetical protein